MPFNLHDRWMSVNRGVTCQRGREFDQEPAAPPIESAPEIPTRDGPIGSPPLGSTKNGGRFGQLATVEGAGKPLPHSEIPDRQEIRAS